MIVPHDHLKAQTLRALIEEFVTRDGALHGHTDTPMDQMVASVLARLRGGRAVIVYDEETETTSIVAKDEVRGEPL